MSIRTSFLAVLPFVAEAVASSIGVKSISTVFQFGYNATIENLAVRPNGNILFTEPSPKATVWEVDPATVNGSARIAASFPNVTTALGISSIGRDLYAVTTGDVGSDDAGEVGTFSVTLLSYEGDGDSPTIVKTIHVPQGKLLNKITPLDSESDIILVSDPEEYHILGLNVTSGSTEFILEDEATMTADSSFPIGVNGIRKVGKYLYYINSSKGLFNRVELASNGTAAGPFETIANLTGKLLIPDDFTVLATGQAFVAGSNEVLYVSSDGSLSILAGGEHSLQLAGTTSALFGVGNNSSTLYVTTTGETTAPANTTVVGPGKIVAIEISGLEHC